ncbi:MAG: molybdenum cofactor guanylyltransferase [Roseiflexaceae bacterium]|nr:molybdenum cofactor guanylyltransferase [Roseiflexaceae bacterium]
MNSDLACIILAGGASSRMGTDKRRLQLWGDHGPNLLEHVLAIAGRLCHERIIVLNDPAQWPQLDAHMVADAYPGTGPLGGVASGLAAMASQRALVLACDMPLLRVELLQGLIEASPGYDVTLPLRHREPDRPRNHFAVEPLLAVYARSCLSVIEDYLQRGERRMIAPLAELRVNTIAPDVWQAWDAHGRSFLNLNRPGDIELLAAQSKDAPTERLYPMLLTPDS